MDERRESWPQAMLSGGTSDGSCTCTGAPGPAGPEPPVASWSAFSHSSPMKRDIRYTWSRPWSYMY